MAKNGKPVNFFESIVREAVKEVATLNESTREGVKFKFGGKEMEFGSPEHVRVLKALLRGLQALRDCYPTGSANRHVYSSACYRLKKLIDKHNG
jgi:hypothetical protein